MMLWAFSLMEARRVFPNVLLVTDKSGAELLKQFPYDEVATILHDDILPPESRKVWSGGKIEAYLHCAKERIEFCHFDGDVIMRRRQHVFGADVFAQSDERFIHPPPYPWEKDPQTHILTGVYLWNGCQNLPYLPESIRLSLTRMIQMPYNMGIFGGKDFDFIQRYSEESLRILRHPDNLKHWGPIASVCAACFTEQYLLGAMAKHESKHVDILFPHVARNCEDYMEAIGYTHLLGDSKRDTELMGLVYAIMQREHPSAFEAVKAMDLPTVTPYIGGENFGHYSSR
jgi:hypothetical protein